MKRANVGKVPLKATANVLLPTLPDPVPLAEATLFAFDDRAFPFRAFAEVHLNGGRGAIVIPAGLPRIS
jgi:hypothetical protein